MSTTTNFKKLIIFFLSIEQSPLKKSLSVHINHMQKSIKNRDLWPCADKQWRNLLPSWEAFPKKIVQDTTAGKQSMAAPDDVSGCEWRDGSLFFRDLVRMRQDAACLPQTYLDLSVGPSYHQLLWQRQLAIKTLDGLFCFLSKVGTIVRNSNAY